MWRGISLANKCLLLFGAAVVLIILATLAVPFFRMNSVVDDAEKELSRKLVEVWEHGLEDRMGVGPVIRPGVEEQVADARLVLMTIDQADRAAADDPFIARASRLFREHGDENELHEARWIGTAREYRYAKVARDEAAAAGSIPAITGMVVLTRRSPDAVSQLLVNLAYVLGAGLIALGLAVLVFYLITTRLILSPVRALRETAELVREGNLAVRSEIRTGDEFEELGQTFNRMLEGINSSQEQLRAINASLDLKVDELTQRNSALFEANKLKGEFLATVSHELRTPLNSIIGFAELLLEQSAKPDHTSPEEQARLAKHRRYLENIHNSGRSLMELIEGVLELAKVEAGRMDLRLKTFNIRDACEALLALIRPLADRAGVELVLDAAPDLPDIETDPAKFQQIVFNLLSNAVKFTGERAADERAAGQNPVARAILRAERLVGRASEGLASEDRLRISVLDTGPGIAPEDQKKIFEKFQQLDTGHTRRHSGTGLGLAICKELTTILQGEIQVESELGRGAMFSVILPLRINAERAKDMKLEMAQRARAELPGAA